jgi:tellurite resistance protein TehA-like permease
VPSARGAVDRLLEGVPPASGAVVMGTGIVSVALVPDGQEALSRILLGVTGAAWVVLAALLLARARRDRARFRHDVRRPAAFTAVAGTAVLGTRLTQLGWSSAGGALLVVAFTLWLGLLGPVLRHWSTASVGTSFMLTVGTESLALLAAVLALEEHVRWLLVASLAPFAVGLGFYLFVASSFDIRELATGRGDHWVTGGALAISTVTAGWITLAADGLGAFRDWGGALTDVSVVLWGLTMLWLPILLAAEVRWPRTSYDVRRWSTVFPVAMYAACSFVVGSVASAPAITDFARVWVWVAVAVWLAVLVGLARRAPALLAGRDVPVDEGSGIL